MRSQVIEDHSAPPYVIVVDDSQTSRRLVAGILRGAGYDVDEAESGERCLELIEGRVPDTVLLDIEMPGLNGLEVTRRLRAKYLRQELPILLVTTHTATETLVAGFQAGANDYITKPIDRRVLLARLDAQVTVVLSQRRLREATEQIALNVKLESIHKFVLGVSHVFNNIFGTITGTIALLRRRVSDERSARLIEVLDAAVQRGAWFTKRIAGMAQEPRASPGADVFMIVGQVVELQRELLISPISIQVHIPSEIARVDIGDISLASILTNLIQNAVEACGERGEIQIRVVDLGDAVRFSVQDSGSGMSEPEKARAFEPFFSTKSLDTLNEVSTLGRGLGLWNVFNLVKSAKGTVQIESETGKGCTVVFTLPVVHGKVSPGKPL